ncbi:PREDICTED: protodermal factor 1 [Ipomoea nil]|uniref:protodermal factor 1 n=1 Tax=Ipomoea nil TaxID=35883 RepID=UPI000900C660|nr:PREDICTED: protodermal factor 1 [Ipomoea nil]XP_019166300.1 PREDICTED: protodermal factor 1 [Ipomoea nil]
MRMERSSKHGSLLLWATMAALLSQNLVVIPAIAAAAFNDQKNYYSPDPNIGTPSTPSGSHGSGGHHGGSSSHHHHGGHGGGGGSYGGGSSPPSNCGTPPSGGHHGGGSHGGGGGGYYSPPTTPSTPSYTPTPPTIPDIPTPTTPDSPTPIVDSPPTPIVPSPPFGLEPSTPPFGFDPNSPPFTCDYWKSHPGLIWGLVGFWGTVGGVFGVASVPAGEFGTNLNLLQALSNTRNDGYGELYREGTASLLNSMLNTKRFPYTTQHVRDSFAAALTSNTAAAAQARLFKLANEGRLKPRSL